MVLIHVLNKSHSPWPGLPQHEQRVHGRGNAHQAPRPRAPWWRAAARAAPLPPGWLPPGGAGPNPRGAGPEEEVGRAAGPYQVSITLS